jgi:hypothetical protein
VLWILLPNGLTDMCYGSCYPMGWRIGAVDRRVGWRIGAVDRRVGWRIGAVDLATQWAGV